jgi:hypothetical protein
MYGFGYSLYNRIPFLGTSGFDPAAQAFISAAGITGATQQTAINNLVKGLKADGIWSKMKAVYPFVTDNRNSMSYTEDFTNAYWSKSGATVTANNTTAPDGTLTADRIVYSTTNNYVYGVSTLLGGVGTQSFYVKGTAGETLYADDGYTSAPLITLTGDWQRVTFTTTRSAGQLHGILVGTYSGATARTIWLWGAQVDAAATATTYQPIATTQQAYIAAQFKYNLVNPVDSDAAFRLVFNGGWTHSSNGATPNGTNGYADTFVNPFLHTLGYSQHVSMYSRTQNTSVSGVQLGVLDTASAEIALFQYYNSVSLKGSTFYTYPARAVKINNTNTLGFQIASRTSNNLLKLYFNNLLLDTNTNTENLTRPNGKMYLGGSNWVSTGPTQYTPHQNAFSSIGDGLTDTEAANLYTRVQAYQTALSRNV